MISARGPNPDPARQVCTHPALASDAEAGPDEEARPPSARLALLARLLPRLLTAGRRVLLLSQTAPALDLLQVQPARGAARRHDRAVRCLAHGLGRPCRGCGAGRSCTALLFQEYVVDAGA